MTFFITIAVNVPLLNAKNKNNLMEFYEKTKRRKNEKL